jgi:hypothetical protein
MRPYQHRKLFAELELQLRAGREMSSDKTQGGNAYTDDSRARAIVARPAFVAGNVLAAFGEKEKV